MSNKSDCCGGQLKRYVKTRNRGSGVICSKCGKPCGVKSEPVPTPDRLAEDYIQKIIQAEVDRQAEFGYEPGWADFVIVGIKEGEAKTASLKDAEIAELKAQREESLRRYELALRVTVNQVKDELQAAHKKELERLNNMSENRLLTHEEITRDCHYEYENEKHDANLTECYTHQAVLRIVKAQDAKTYPLAFEAGKKAQAEKDRAEIDEYRELRKVEIGQLLHGVILEHKQAIAEAEKRGAREYKVWLETSCTNKGHKKYGFKHPNCPNCCKDYEYLDLDICLDHHGFYVQRKSDCPVCKKQVKLKSLEE